MAMSSKTCLNDGGAIAWLVVRAAWGAVAAGLSERARGGSGTYGSYQWGSSRRCFDAPMR